MGKFSKIKKYNLDSLSIDEKIKFLDKEMEKTGLNENQLIAQKEFMFQHQLLLIKILVILKL